MSGSHAHGHTANPFSAAEWDKFQADDRHAAVLVIGLMGAIFTIGLVLYSFVLFTCLSGT